MSKILININNIKEIEEYKKIGITNFLFAVSKLSVGYNSFDIDSIPDDTYILINRILDTDAVDYIKSIKDKFMRFKGIIYEDIAVFNIFSNSNLELIWFQNHFTTNYESINFWLDNGCNSAIISNEITKDEIDKIISAAHKPLILNILGKNQIMYSRRSLLTNFNKYANLENNNDMVLDTINNDTKFFARECEFGTVLFNNTYFNYINLIPEYESKVKFFLIMNLDLNVDEIRNILEGNVFGDDGFLNKRTVYKMAEYNDR
jgi:hypothetical protein